MLHKRFKVAKCKTSLKLASSRIKLMKNKKGIQINQIKKDLAQLLESGQDRTARIRVEHVIREEKMVAAYELIEIYCELIVARLPIIESQKTCPIDLKEAITSVIFAAPRCSDIPELLDIQKHFAAKYGKDFITGAIELRPDCGVSRMLVEKLSAIAPDVQTKMKVLSAVAKEHNINWDPTSFEEKESKPPNDLLNGPGNFEKASVDLPTIPTSNAQNVQSHVEKPKAPVDFSQQNKRYTLPPETGGVQTPYASATHDEMRSSGMGSERMNTNHSFHSNGNHSSSHRENWNMEFKDATSAAQAAAESAERASMAARAAAQLSTQEKITRQNSTESHDSRFRNETPRHSKYSYNSSFKDRNPNIQNQQMRPNEHNAQVFTTSERPNISSFNDQKNQQVSRPISRSRNDSEESLVNNVHQADRYVKRSSSPETIEKNEYKPGFRRVENETSKTTKIDHFMEEGSRKQPSINSTHSHSSTINDELEVLNSTQQKPSKETPIGNPFAVVNQGNVFNETTSTNSYVDSHRGDEADSDDNGPRFDTGFEYDEGEAKSFFPSPGRESINALENKNTHIFSEMRTLSSHSTKSVDPSVHFDHSDGPDSESESELAKPSLVATKLTSPRKNVIELNDLVKVETEKSFFFDGDDKHDDSETGNDLMFGRLTGGLRNKGGFKYPPYTKTVEVLPEKMVGESLVTVDRSSFGSKMNRLDGEKRSDPVSSSDSDSDEYSDRGKTVISPTKNRSRFAAPDLFFNGNGTDSEEEAAPVPKLSTSRVRLGSGVVSRRTKGNVEPTGKTVISHTNESLAESRYSENFKKEQKPDKPSYYNETQPDPRPDPPSSKQEASRKMPEPRGKTVISPTKESTSKSRLYTEKWKKEPTQVPDSSKQKADKRYYSNEAQPDQLPDPPSSKQEAPRKMPEPRGETVISPAQESAAESRLYSDNFKKEPTQIPESSKPKPNKPSYDNNPNPRPGPASSKQEPSKASNISTESSSGANNVKKPSHVHPKLPEYDSLAARIQSLRSNHQ